MSDAYQEALRRIEGLQRIIEQDTVADLEARFLSESGPAGEIVTFGSLPAPATADDETSCDGFFSVVLSIG